MYIVPRQDLQPGRDPFYLLVWRWLWHSLQAPRSTMLQAWCFARRAEYFWRLLRWYGDARYVVDVLEADGSLVVRYLVALLCLSQFRETW